MSEDRNFDRVARNFLKSVLLSQTNNRCAYCGKSINAQNMHIEHIHPLSKGGANDPSNLVAACKSCNMSKGTLSLDKFRLVIWFRTKFATSQKFTPAQIFDLSELGFFDNIPEERNHTGFKFYYPPLNESFEAPF